MDISLFFSTIKIIFTTLLSLFDPFTDIYITVKFFLEKDMNLGYLSTVSLALSGIAQAYLTYMHFTKSFFISFLSLIGLGPLYYSYNTFQHVYNGDSEKTIAFDNHSGEGARLTKMFEVIFEAVPQFIIQTYGCIELGKMDKDNLDPFLLVSIFTSLASVGLFHYSFTKSKRIRVDYESPKIKLIAIAIMRFFDVGSHIFSIILMISILRQYVFFIVLFELLLSTAFFAIFWEDQIGVARNNYLKRILISFSSSIENFFFITFDFTNLSYCIFINFYRVILSYILRLLVYIATIVLVLVYGETIYLRDECTGDDCWSYSFIFPVSFYICLIMIIAFLILFPLTYWWCVLSDKEPEKYEKKNIVNDDIAQEPENEDINVDTI